MLGSLIPVLIFILVQEVFTIKRGITVMPRFDENTILVLSIVGNLIPFSYYMKKPQFEKTVQGILLVTFFYAAIYIFVKFIRQH